MNNSITKFEFNKTFLSKYICHCSLFRRVVHIDDKTVIQTFDFYCDQLIKFILTKKSYNNFENKERENKYLEWAKSFCEQNEIKKSCVNDFAFIFTAISESIIRNTKEGNDLPSVFYQIEDEYYTSILPMLIEVSNKIDSEYIEKISIKINGHKPIHISNTIT